MKYKENTRMVMHTFHSMGCLASARQPLDTAHTLRTTSRIVSRPSTSATITSTGSARYSGPYARS